MNADLIVGWSSIGLSVLTLIGVPFMCVRMDMKRQRSKP